MADDQRDGMGVVVKALLFSAAVLVAAGAWLVATSRQPMIGVLVLAAGLVDGAMAWGLGRAGRA